MLVFALALLAFAAFLIGYGAAALIADFIRVMRRSMGEDV